MESEALRLIAKAATGSLRDAENLLEQLATYYGTEIELQQVQTILGITGDWRAKELVKHIINNDVSAGMVTINSVNSDGLDLRQFNRELVEYLRGLLLIKAGSDEAIDLTAEDITELKDLAARASLSQILKAVKLFGQLELGFDNYSTLPLELALVDCTLPPAEEELPSKAEYEPPPPVKTATLPVTPPRPKRPVAKPEPASTLAPPPTAEITPATPPEPGSEIESLRLNWRQFIKEAPSGISRTPAAALLRSAKPKAIEKDTVVLSFKYPLHKENMEKSDNQQIAEKIISGFLGRSCRVRCIYEPEDNHLVEEVLKIGAQIIDAEEK
jgi:DNA polymerase-3 subunit gamma/tau